MPEQDSKTVIDVQHPDVRDVNPASYPYRSRWKSESNPLRLLQKTWKGSLPKTLISVTKIGWLPVTNMMHTSLRDAWKHNASQKYLSREDLTPEVEKDIIARGRFKGDPKNLHRLNPEGIEQILSNRRKAFEEVTGIECNAKHTEILLYNQDKKIVASINTSVGRAVHSRLHAGEAEDKKGEYALGNSLLSDLNIKGREKRLSLGSVANGVLNMWHHHKGAVASWAIVGAGSGAAALGAKLTIGAAHIVIPKAVALTTHALTAVQNLTIVTSLMGSAVAVWAGNKLSGGMLGRNAGRIGRGIKDSLRGQGSVYVGKGLGQNRGLTQEPHNRGEEGSQSQEALLHDSTRDLAAGAQAHQAGPGAAGDPLAKSNEGVLDGVKDLQEASSRNSSQETLVHDVADTTTPSDHLREEPSSELEYVRFKDGERIPETMKKGEGGSLSGLLAIAAPVYDSAGKILFDPSKEVLVKRAVLTNKSGEERELGHISVALEKLAEHKVDTKHLDYARKNAPYVNFGYDTSGFFCKTSKNPFNGPLRAPQDKIHGRTGSVRA